TGSQWTSVPNGISSPGPRYQHSMAYGSAQGQLLLFGGGDQNSWFGDTWKWDGNAWILLATNGPGLRASQAMVYNDNCDKVVLFGGYDTNYNNLSDTWEWN